MAVCYWGSHPFLAITVGFGIRWSLAGLNLTCWARRKITQQKSACLSVKLVSWITSVKAWQASKLVQGMKLEEVSGMGTRRCMERWDGAAGPHLQVAVRYPKVNLLWNFGRAGLASHFQCCQFSALNTTKNWYACEVCSFTRAQMTGFSWLFRSNIQITSFPYKVSEKTLTPSLQQDLQSSVLLGITGLLYTVFP